jgi:hypothetical protein
MKIARIICWPPDSTLRPTFDASIPVAPSVIVDCRRAGQKNENCANYLLASGFDFTPDDRGADLISFRQQAGIDMRRNKFALHGSGNRSKKMN